MGKLAEAYVEIGSKTAGFDSGLGKSEKSLMEFVARANSMLGAIGVGVGTAGMVSFLQSAAKAGSDLNETISKTGQVFGSATAGVMAFADQMATQFGAVKTVTLDAAAMFGLITQGVGMTAEQSAKLSTQLVRLADDAGSFFNVSLDTALEKIRAGLVGESEPLRAFGVMLSESAVQQKALEMGLVATTKELTEQEKVLARIQLITEGLAKAQGDHARTMDGYAAQVKQLNGQLENFRANIGAGVAAGEADFMRELQQNGLLAAIGKFTMNAAASPLQRNAGNFDVFQRAADQAAGVQHLKLPAAGGGKAAADMAVFNNILAAAQGVGDKRRAEAVVPGGFGAFGMFGNIAPMIADLGGQALDARQRRFNQQSWSGGWGAMGTMDFLRSAQESINKPKDETEKKQLEELQKIREALTKPVQAMRQGVVLRGPA